MNVVKVLIQATIIITLIHLVGAVNYQAFSQEPESDIRITELPVSISAPVFIYWDKDSRGNRGYSWGGTVSALITKAINVGISIRASGSASGRKIATDEWRLYEQTENMSYLIHANWYPSRKHLIFLRMAGGVSSVYEQDAVWSYIKESRSWPATLLTGVGWDLRIAHHFYITPLLEYIRIFHHEPSLRTTKHWLIKLGLGITIR
jgi:hypothetical protein